jgi:hypothetical protein
MTSKALVFVGLISYSLYLWHWPVLAFLRYFLGDIDLASGTVAVVVMTCLSVLSYWFVEQPARKWKAATGKQLAILYILPGVALCGLGLAILSTHGLKAVIGGSARYASGVTDLKAYTAPAYDFDFNCQLSAFDSKILSKSKCLIGPNSDSDGTGMLLWGDSRAAQFVGLLSQVAKKGDFQFRNATFSSCPPLFGESPGDPPYRSGCVEFRKLVERAIRDHRFGTVVVSGAWDYYDKDPAFRKNFRMTVSNIINEGASLIILGENPVFKHYSRKCELRGLRIGGVDCQGRAQEADAGEARANVFLKGLADTYPSVSFVSTRNLVCHAGNCSPYLDGHPIYFDQAHISMAGSVSLGKKLVTGPDFETWNRLFNRKAAQPVQLAPVSDSASLGRSLSPALAKLRLDFPHRLRAKHIALSPSGPSGAIVEAWGLSTDQITAKVIADFRAIGFELQESKKYSDSVRLEFLSQGQPATTVFVESRPPLTRLHVKTANQVIYFHW